MHALRVARVASERASKLQARGAARTHYAADTVPCCNGIEKKQEPARASRASDLREL